MIRLEEASAICRYWPATETFRSGWSDTQLGSDLTTTPEHMIDVELLISPG